ncbi:MAG: type VI secretion system baseplate subunit TssE [Planctomycetaceae bacterium]|nr:type VI secretion system baseplate subunit TssE [Planctomycetaceae bacterium]MCA9066092.1 type VI secretion system baseplate subunit TssE [Planctomycetaceae bacterium]
MADRNSDLSVRVSLLDRLLDDEPQTSREVPWDDVARMRIIRRGIKRDLLDLLNTRFRCVAWQTELNELDESLMNYGLPDFTAAGLNLAYDPDLLLQAIRRAIRMFEPRLADVRVEALADSFHIDRTFRFRIDAVLLIEHQRVPMQFDSTIESRTGQFSIGESAE